MTPTHTSAAGEGQAHKKSNDIVSAVKTLRSTVQNQLAVQRKIFTFLNGFAKGDHMKQWSRVEFNDIICQVYGDLAAHFSELESAAKL